MARKGSLKSKAIGLGAVGLVALGIWLGQYFPGFGLGKGLGFGTGSNESGRSDPAGGPPGSGEPSATVAGREMPQSPVPPTPERLRVIIDGETYILAASDAGHEGETLDASEIARRARSVAGDDQGIRIRIERTKRATAGARKNLLEALDAAGIQRDARHESMEFLEPPL